MRIPCLDDRPPSPVIRRTLETSSPCSIEHAARALALPLEEVRAAVAVGLVRLDDDGMVIDLDEVAILPVRRSSHDGIDRRAGRVVNRGR
ncbi:hypothetical protein [Pseudonocardia xishanensis]|uniref:Uncharacterized protein n=1 Tax=Pseudonocardia xishanensis TaxID=630995 RepID=A0ABP8RSL0_9PSEU